MNKLMVPFTDDRHASVKDGNACYRF